MATLRIDGFELYYESHGEGSPVVCAHGVGGNHASWYNQIPVLSRHYRMITFDHRGFGNSRDTADGPGRARFVADLLALLDHLDIPKAALIAQSMGGGTCAGFTVKHPERVAALVLADTLVGLKLPPPLAERLAAVGKATENLSQKERVLGPTFLRREPALSELYVQLASFNQVNRKTLRGSLGAGVTPDEIAATGVPVIFMVGKEDVLFPPELVAGAHRLVPGSRYVEIPAAGHSAYFESPAAINDAVLGFLRPLLTAA